MTPQQRRPGRPAHGSREKLVSAARELFTERGVTATSPTMMLNRSSVGHGSLFHYFDGKEALALASAEQMRADVMARLGLEKSNEPNGGAYAGNLGKTGIDAILYGYFTQTDGRALLHLLTDPGVNESEVLSRKVRAWCGELWAAIHVAVTDKNTEGTRDGITPGRLHEIGDPHLVAAPGRGLLALPRKVDLLHPADPR